MKFLIVFLSLIALSSATLNILREWNEYKKKYGKDYNLFEDIYRKTIYIANSNYIRLFNLRNDRGCETYRLGINQFTDLTYADYAAIFQQNSNAPPLTNALPPFGACNNEKVNGAVWENNDWTNFGAVSPVQDQGLSCNAGWAFAALSTLESQHYIAHNTKPLPLSAQNLIDCITPQSCASKTPIEAYQYVINNQNVNPISSYPYEGRVSSCRYNPNIIGATCADFQRFAGSESQLKDQVLNLGPVAIEIDPLSFTFMHYESGIYRPPTTQQIATKHYLSLVGTGNDDKSGNYWIAKNSFGTTWGENGFIRIISNARIPTSVSYPIV